MAKTKITTQKEALAAVQENGLELENVLAEITHSQKAIDMLNAAIERQNKNK